MYPVETLDVSLARMVAEAAYKAVHGLAIDIGKLAELAGEHMSLQDLDWCILCDSGAIILSIAPTSDLPEGI